MLLKSLEYTNAEDRPDEIYLCAPAVNELEFKDFIPHAAKENLYIFYNENDMVLGYIFPLIERHPAMGCVGPIYKYGERCKAFSVEKYFDFLVHSQYKSCFDKIVAGEIYTKE